MIEVQGNTGEPCKVEFRSPKGTTISVWHIPAGGWIQVDFAPFITNYFDEIEIWINGERDSIWRSK
jgi:hypothetical protein